MLDLAWCSRRLCEVMRGITSPIPIGLTPGHLSRATSQQPLYAIKSSGGIMDVASLLANLATSLHRFVEVCPKAVYASHQHRDLKARHCHESSLHAFGQALHWFCRTQRGGREACVDVGSECSWAPRVALQDVCGVKSWGPVYRLWDR